MKKKAVFKCLNLLRTYITKFETADFFLDDNKILRLVILFALNFFTYYTVTAQNVAVQNKSRGAICNGEFATVEQPDGTEIRLRKVGDYLLNWFESEDGLKVLMDSTGYYCYAILDREGNMISSNEQFSNLKSANGYSKDIFFSDQQIKEKESGFYGTLKSISLESTFPSKGTDLNVLLILAEFSDVKHVKPRNEFNDLMNKENHPTGSFRDYFNSVSYNQFIPRTTVTDWVTVSKSMVYYGENDVMGNDKRADEFVREALDSLEVNGFDFSIFDNDKDGVLDGLIVVHSGFGEEYTEANPDFIWSHRAPLRSYEVSYDGVLINNYAIFRELRGTSDTTLTDIGVICHEFGHILGLPDFYDTDYEGSGGQAWHLNKWDLMASGNNNNYGQTPAGINAWSKAFLGWIDEIPEIDTSGSFSLDELHNNQQAFKIKTKIDGEYFLLENRQKVGFDSYLPSNGMLIYHIDENHSGWSNNKINADPDHQAFDIEEADNIGDLVTVLDDPFPGGSGATEYSNISEPNSKIWARVIDDLDESYITIFDITENSGVINFNAERVLIRSINALAPLKTGEWTKIQVDIMSTEAEDYYVGIWDDDGFTAPQWEWSTDYTSLSPNIGSQVHSLEEHQKKSIFFSVKPTGLSENFEFWLYRKDFLGAFKVIQKIKHTLQATLGDDPQPNLVISTQNISLNYGATSNDVFDITSNTNWNVSDDADWLDVEPVSGSNNGTITVMANSENTGPDPRTASVTISGSGVADQIVTVTQDNQSVNVVATLGNTDIYGSTSLVANRRALPVTFTEDGVITSISIYHNGGSGNLILAVYSDQTGLPSSRLGKNCLNFKFSPLLFLRIVE